MRLVRENRIAVALGAFVFLACVFAAMGAGEVTGNLAAGSVKDTHINASAAIATTKLAQRSLVSFPHSLTWLRTWDALEMPLVGTGSAKASQEEAAVIWQPTSVDTPFFTAVRKYRVVGITARVEVAGTDGGAVTAVIKKAPSATAITAGTALHTGTLNLKGTAATNQTLSLSATSTDLDIAIGDSIGIDYTGTLTSATGTVSVLLAPAVPADDLLISTGTFASGPPQVQTRDLKAAGATTCRARTILSMPDNFVSAGNVSIRCNVGMNTTIADTSATVLVEAYLLNTDGTLSANLVSTTATTCNSLTLTNRDFIVDGTSLVAGSRLDVRVSFAVSDAGSVTAVKAVLQDLILRCDVQP